MTYYGDQQVIAKLKQPNNGFQKQSALSMYNRKNNGNNNKQAKSNDGKYNPICWRFPESPICGCTRPCRQAVSNSKIFEIIPGLFVGPAVTAFRHQYLYETKNIRSILNVSREKYSINKNKYQFKYLQINIDDDVNQDILKYFDTAIKFIDNGLKIKINEKNDNMSNDNKDNSNVKNHKTEEKVDAKQDSGNNSNYNDAKENENDKEKEKGKDKEVEKQTGGVYVHCRAGISRSPSFIMAYLIWKNRITFKQADNIVGKVHPDALPNSNFVKELEKFSKLLIEKDQENQIKE